MLGNDGEANRMQVDNPKILSVEEMRAERDRLAAEGKTLVFTNGCFDILHRGHVTYLAFARNQGDALVVGLNTDASVRANKGDDRPINSEGDRAFVLGSLRAVDYVVLFGDDEPKEIIARILPQVLVKGKDWAHYVSGRDVVEANGGRVVLADMVEGRSTTSTIERIVHVYGRDGGGRE
jgi:D-glycero-beta-D-manno-heptose 1-phosphate adenylyltransferase